MAARRSRPSSPSTTHGSISADSDDSGLNLNDRYRLHMQMDRELNHPSYATSTGAHEEDDTVGSFDIEAGADAMSTRYKMIGNMLPLQSPDVLDSKIINAHFADFTMDGAPIMPDYQDDMDSFEIEIGRNNGKPGSSKLHYHAFSTTPKAGPSKANQRAFPSSPSGFIDGPGTGAAARQNIRAASRLAPQQAKHTQSASPNPAKRMQSKSPRPAEPKKSNVQSQRQQAFASDMSDSTITSIDRPQGAPNTRFVGATQKAAPNQRVSSIQKEVTEELQKAAQDANTFTEGRRSAPAAVREEQRTVRRNIPSGFKSASQFLGELGFEVDNKEKTKGTPGKQQQQHLKPGAHSNAPASRTPVSKPLAPNSTYQSFRLPDMTGMSDLVSRYINNEQSAHIAAAHHPASHIPIESIPLPEDERAIMMALSILQEKVRSLEAKNAEDEMRNTELEQNLEHTKELYSIEVQGRRAAEAELNQRKRSDSALGTDNDSERGGNNWAEDREKLQTKKAIERIRLENTISSQRQRIETLEHKLEVAQISLHNANEERNNLVNSFAAMVANEKALIEENDLLKSELERLQLLLQEHDNVTSDDRAMLETKIARYREKVKRLNAAAKEATTMAQESNRLLRAARATSVGKSGPDSAPVVSTSKSGKNNTVATTVQQVAPQKAIKKSNLRNQQSERHQPAAEPMQAGQAAAPPQETAKPSLRPTTKQTQAPSKSQPATKRRRKRIILQEVSETEDEGDETIQFAQDAGNQSVPQFNETSFTDYDKENEQPESTNVSIHVREETLISLVNEEDVALLRAQIEEERRYLENVAAASAAQSSQAAQQKPKPVEQVRQPKEAEFQKQGAGRQKRVLIYSPDVSETSASEVADSQSEDSESDVEEPPRAPQVSDHIQDVLDNLGIHDELRCTVCRRKAEIEFCQVNGHSGNIVYPADNEDAIKPTEVVPVSKRMPVPKEDEYRWEEEPTMRPSIAPKDALEKVIQGLTDEFNHLRLDYDAARAEFLTLDPSMGKRNRKKVTVKLNSIVEEIDKKADQIYHLYDVAEQTHKDNDSNSEQAENPNHFGKGKAKASSIGI